jgi:hypothetical protein
MGFKLVSNGERIKFYFDSNVGGSFPVSHEGVRGYSTKGKIGGSADFVEDGEKWRSDSEKRNR